MANVEHAESRVPEKGSGFCIAKLKKDTHAKGKDWPAGTLISRDGVVVVWNMDHVKGFESMWDLVPVECGNSNFELKEVKKG